MVSRWDIHTARPVWEYTRRILSIVAPSLLQKGRRAAAGTGRLAVRGQAALVGLLVFPEEMHFSMYALSALLPLLPAKQRELDPNDWMLSDTEIACPDPNCGARFRITRTGRREFSHAGCTVVPLPGTEDKV